MLDVSTHHTDAAPWVVGSATAKASAEACEMFGGRASFSCWREHPRTLGGSVLVNRREEVSHLLLGIHVCDWNRLSAQSGGGSAVRTGHLRMVPISHF